MRDESLSYIDTAGIVLSIITIPQKYGLLFVVEVS